MRELKEYLSKYISIFRISFAQEFAYKLNFVMWRVRNVIQVFVVFYFWDTAFSESQSTIFGYDRAKILTYTFGILLVRAVVLSARAVDVSGQIANGDLSNLLLKPFGFMKYWFTRDLSSKSLNLMFAVGETSVLFFVLKPPLFLQTNGYLLLEFMIFLVLATILFYLILFLVNMVAFWMPENGWAAQFLFIVIITEFLSGGTLPLDIFPESVQMILRMLPFGYLIFFPIQVYLGKISQSIIFQGFAIEVFWILILLFLVKSVWQKGLKNYASEGR